MRKRLTRAEQRERTRTQLLDAAEAVFIRDGFHAASVDEIAESAGYSKGAVYSNFDGKDELFLALLERRIDSRQLAIADNVRTDASLPDQVTQAGTQYVTMLLDQSQWSLLLMEFAAYAARDQDLRAQFAVRNRRMRTAMAALIDQHLEALGLRAPIPTEDLATILFALGSGYILERLTDPDSVPDTLFTSALGLLFSGLTPAPPTRKKAASNGRAGSASRGKAPPRRRVT